MEETLQIRVFGDTSLPTLIYLPGTHGDWTLITAFRAALRGRARFVEITYPRTLTWSVADYARAIENALREKGIPGGWLLGESFGSQIAWELLHLHENSLRYEGLILAGGFVKHPMKWGPGFLKWVGTKISMKQYRRGLRIYSWFARSRHRNAPETLDSIKDFVVRRTELDREAMRHRLTLIATNDPRAIARQIMLPVYYLAGLVDPLVPWILVRWWLGKNCPGYRSGRTFWLADHNVLATAPAATADQVMIWLAEKRRMRRSREPIAVAVE